MRLGLLLSILTLLAAAAAFQFSSSFTSPAPKIALPPGTALPPLSEPEAEMPIGFEAAKRNIRRIDDDNEESTQSLKRDAPELIARLPAVKTAKVESTEEEPATLQTSVVKINRPLIEQTGILRNNDYWVVLDGISTPSVDHTCVDGAQNWPCGRFARTAMRRFVRGRTVTCIIQAKPSNEAQKGQCTVGGIDIAAWLVEQGWAKVNQSSAHAQLMTSAQNKAKGVWRNRQSYPDFGD